MRKKQFYISLVDERGKIKIWLVDGSYIRGRIDEEFTNFGQHYRYLYIPVNEFWLDHEGERREHQFFIDHLLTEHRLMAEGASYDEALSAADKVEQRERRRSKDLKKITNNFEKLPDGHDVHKLLWRKLSNGIKAWVVDGSLVRSVFDIDFTAGGHDHVYEFVPQNEVWIDDAIVEPERGYVLLHELHERNRMQEGLPYEQAHCESSKLEFHCRHFPDELHEALVAEGWV